MTVRTEKLVRMAEQISANMAYTDDQALVTARIADHLGRFWDPRMQAAIKAYQKENPDGLSPALAAAVASLEPA